jgi:beta-galactosidase
VSDGAGGDPLKQHVSAYEIYTAPFGASADKVFASQDKHPYVSGEFVWTGWDYLGEPTPYYGARSSYSGIIDLAGFKKDRFYLYQSRWRPELPMAHILPHWNWPERIGKITPVHVFTSGDEAELFLNGNSLGRKKKGEFEYRLRWDDVIYEPGELKVVAYKNGEKWVENIVKTSGQSAKLEATADRTIISANGKDLAFVRVKVTDQEGFTVPVADNLISFSIEGPGKIIATDNGDPADMTEFKSTERHAFNGLALAIIQSERCKKGDITVKVQSAGLEETTIQISSK